MGCHAAWLWVGSLQQPSAFVRYTALSCCATTPTRPPGAVSAPAQSLYYISPACLLALLVPWGEQQAPAPQQPASSPGTLAAAAAVLLQWLLPA